jgi:hypothetical protein
LFDIVVLPTAFNLNVDGGCGHTNIQFYGHTNFQANVHTNFQANGPTNVDLNNIGNRVNLNNVSGANQVNLGQESQLSSMEEILQFLKVEIGGNKETILQLLAKPFQNGGWKGVAVNALKAGGVSFLVGLIKGIVVGLLPENWRSRVDVVFNVAAIALGVGFVAVK